MIIGIIEFRIKPGLEDRYAEVAAHLHAHVQSIPGFISVERFESRTHEGKLLSLSYWENAEALKKWRDDPDHRIGMKIGREEVFADYRIVIAGVDREYKFQAKD